MIKGNCNSKIFYFLYCFYPDLFAFFFLFWRRIFYSI